MRSISSKNNKGEDVRKGAQGRFGKCRRGKEGKDHGIEKLCMQEQGGRMINFLIEMQRSSRLARM